MKRFWRRTKALPRKRSWKLDPKRPIRAGSQKKVTKFEEIGIWLTPLLQAKDIIMDKSPDGKLRLAHSNFQGGRGQPKVRHD